MFTAQIKEAPAGRTGVEVKPIELSTTILLTLISFNGGVERSKLKPQQLRNHRRILFASC